MGLLVEALPADIQGQAVPGPATYVSMVVAGSEEWTRLDATAASRRYVHPDTGSCVVISHADLRATTTDQGAALIQVDMRAVAGSQAGGEEAGPELSADSAFSVDLGSGDQVIARTGVSGSVTVAGAGEISNIPVPAAGCVRISGPARPCAITNWREASGIRVTVKGAMGRARVWRAAGAQAAGRGGITRVLVYQIVLIGLRNMRPYSVIINLFCCCHPL